MRLPEGVDAERAKAQFKRGVLTLTIPKKDEVKANRRKLEITAG
jgi:HSP20 family protein